MDACLDVCSFECIAVYEGKILETMEISSGKHSSSLQKYSLSALSHAANAARCALESLGTVPALDVESMLARRAEESEISSCAFGIGVWSAALEVELGATLLPMWEESSRIGWFPHHSWSIPFGILVCGENVFARSLSSMVKGPLFGAGIYEFALFISRGRVRNSGSNMLTHSRQNVDTDMMSPDTRDESYEITTTSGKNDEERGPSANDIRKDSSEFSFRCSIRNVPFTTLSILSPFRVFFF